MPEPASVREDDDELYILDAPLTVKMESEEIVDPPSAAGCPQRAAGRRGRARRSCSERLILPQVIEAVNTAPEYAALRRVYLARVAAEWFRARSGEHPTAVSRIADSGDVEPWPRAPAVEPDGRLQPDAHVDPQRRVDGRARRARPAARCTSAR